MTDGRSTDWGRIAEDGTVYLRTATGERPVGSWLAGSPEEGLAFFARKYDDLAADVALLEQRLAGDLGDAKQLKASALRLQESLGEANVVGDLEALDRRLAAVAEGADARLGRVAEQRAAAAAAAADHKRGLAEEAERLAGSTEWRATGERFRALVEEWKTIRGVDKRTDAELWERLASARREFDHRRKAHFAELETTRQAAGERKQQLVLEAEKLAGSTEWGPTARRFKELMTAWKAAGRADRETDDALWSRFKAAQDGFFAKRSETFAVRDAEQRGNLEQKESLLAEAEAIDPVADPEGAQRRLRHLQDRWEKVGHVPRDAVDRLERRLEAVEDRVRSATSSRRPVTVTESPLVVRLRESVAKLEHRIERARAAGDEKELAAAQDALATQREWLDQAERSSR